MAVEKMIGRARLSSKLRMLLLHAIHPPCAPTALLKFPVQISTCEEDAEERPCATIW